MKYIYIILICFLGIATQAQVQKQPRSNFPTVVDSSLAIGKNFILPVFRSFSQLATYTNLDSSGRLVFIRDSNAVFYRDNAHQWVKFNSGSSGSAVWGSITGTLSNQTDLQTVLDSKVDSVILRGGDSLYNHYATGEVQFIGLLSGGSVSDTLIVTFPLYVNETNDTLSIPQASTDSSGYLSASDWNYFAVKPDSTVLNATGDTLLSYLGSTVIYSHAISGGGGGTNIGNSDLTITDDLRTLNLKADGAFRILGIGTNDVEFRIDDLTGTMSYPQVGGLFEVNKGISPVLKIRGDAEIDSLRIGTTDKIGFPLHVAGDGTNTAVFMNGNVGIGTTTPDAKLEIIGTDTNVISTSLLSNTVKSTDSMVVRDATTGNFKVAVKPSGGGAVTSLTTNGTIGAATLSSGVLNVPRYDTAAYFDMIGSGASNMSGRDTGWKALTPTTFANVQSFNSSNLFVTASPALNNICYSDPGTTATRNNTAWQFGIDYWKDNLEDTVRMVVNAVGSSGSWEWTPQTTGVGEVNTSNARLTALMTMLDATPLNYKAKVIIMQYGEQDAVNANIQFLDTNVIKFYDTLIRHRACDTAIRMLLVYPISNQPINGDSLRLSLDSFYYRTRRMGQRNIMAVPHNYPGTTSTHPSNDTTTLIAKTTYSNYIQGFSNGPKQPDSNFWKKSISPAFVWSTDKIVVGSNSTINSTYNLNVSVAGTSTLAYFGRTNSGSNGNQQGLVFAANNSSSGGFGLIHRSEKSSAITDRNGLVFADTLMSFVDSNQTTLGLAISNNSVQISKPLTISANSLQSGTALFTGTAGSLPIRIFGGSATGTNQMEIAVASTTSGQGPGVKFRSGSLGTFTGATISAPLNAGASGAHFDIKTSTGGAVALGLRVSDSSKVGIGTTTIQAALQIKAGTATAWTAPLKFTSGTNLTTPENGAFEYDGTNYFVTSGDVRYTLAKTLTNTATLDFPSVASLGVQSLTITVTGAADGDALNIGVPNGSNTAGLVFTSLITSANTVTIQCYNSTLGAIDPSSGTFRASVLKY